jgi:DNA-binding PadR family transcriptional regulator
LSVCNINKKNDEIVSTKEILKEMRERIVKSFLDVIVLAKMSETSTPVSDHEITNFIQREFGAISSPASLSVLFYSCEKEGLITSSDFRKTKRYSLTTKGKNTLKIINREKPRIINSILEFLLIEIS